MQVLHRLSGAAPVVRHEAERRKLGRGRHAARDALQVPQQRRVGVRGRGKGPKMLLGDHQHVRRSLGADVLEDERFVVLVDDLGGNLASDDPAEQSLIHQVSPEIIAV